MNTENYSFTKKIYKSINQDGSVNQTVSIDIQMQDTGVFLPTPFTAFLVEYKNKKTSTVSIVASIIVIFLNYLFFEMDSPIKSISEVTFQNGIDFLCSLSCQNKTKTRYAEYLTKFYCFCKDNNMAEIRDFKDEICVKNIFEGKYQVSSKKKVDTIYEIDTAYLPMFFDVARDIVPEIYLGLFLQFAGGLRLSEIVSVEYDNIRVINESGIMMLSIKLEDKDLRPDLSSAFISKVRKNRTQMVLPLFGNRLEKAYETHVKCYKKEDVSAVFVDKNGNPMTANTYWRKFNRVKKEFIKRLYECSNLEAQIYALYLDTYNWSTCIGRGTFSNILAQNVSNIGEVAVLQGNSTLQSLSYINKAAEQRIQDNFIKNSTKENVI